MYSQSDWFGILLAKFLKSTKTFPSEFLELPSLAMSQPVFLRIYTLALRLLKSSLNAADDGLAGVQQLAGDATLLFYMSEEGQEGRDAYKEKRAPDFEKFPKRP